MLLKLKGHPGIDYSGIAETNFNFKRNILTLVFETGRTLEVELSAIEYPFLSFPASPSSPTVPPVPPKPPKVPPVGTK